MPVPFDPHRFRTNAAYYVSGRLSYPDTLIERVAVRIGLARQDRVLDLGCGPGFLAAAFAGRAGEIVAVDPEAEMLAVAAAYARERGLQISFREGSSYALADDLGLFRLVTMGRSFHWMDRAQTLGRLAQLTTGDAVVGLFHDHHLDIPENRWTRLFKEVMEPYKRRDAGRTMFGFESPSWVRHEAFLLDSAFSRLERISVIQRLQTPIERLIDRALSMSATSPERLADELPEFVSKLERVLRQEAPSGVLPEVVESEALLGFKVARA